MIRYFNEDIKFVLKQKLLNNRWLKTVAGSEMRRIGDINIIFCSDNYILDVNMKYLEHDYFTDIITFDYCEKDILSGDLFISIDSVRENASFYGTDFEDELNRVMVHGILHLIGYDDHSESDIAQMRAKPRIASISGRYSSGRISPRGRRKVRCRLHHGGLSR